MPAYPLEGLPVCVRREVGAYLERAFSLLPMLRRFVALTALALVAVLPAAGQNVRLQLVDHIVGSALLHNAPLPSGTDVWVMGRADARAVRLRGGYDEVLGGLPTATRDKLGASGFTEKSYAPTARSRRALFVVARLPDGRLFQSYVKTADEGWQPGFDAIQGGRVSMGRVPAAAAARLDAALAPATPAADTARTATASPNPTVAPQADTAALGAARRDSLAAAGALAPSDTLLADSTRAATGVEPVSAVPSSAVPVTDDDAPRAARRWAWMPFLLGLAAGGVFVGALLALRYERMLKRQRDHLMRLVPDDAERERAEAERAGRVRAAQEAEQQHSDRVFKQIEMLQEALRGRDAEIARLRRKQD